MARAVRTRPWGFGFVTGLSTFVLIIYAVVTLLSFGAGFTELDLLLNIKNGGLVTISDAERVEVLRSASAGLQVLALLICCIVVSVWIFQAKAGARAIGAVDMAFSPFASVAWFFVPIAYLWMPYRAMSETWRASQDPAEWRSQSVPLLVRTWWGFWVLYMLSGRAVTALLRGPGTINEYLWAHAMAQANDIFSLVAAILLIVVIQRLSGYQNYWHDQIEKYAFDRSSTREPALIGT